jgi:acyl-coenzyme A synthetase/AMP-(fatty) acid ligase
MTSGSTGEARGVAATSAALMADDEALRACTGIESGDRLIDAIPFSHSYGLSSLVLPAIVSGVPIVMTEGAGPFAPIIAAKRSDATVLHTVPAWISAMARLAESPSLPESLRLVISAGGPLPPQAARDFRLKCGLPVHAFYGATECGGIASFASTCARLTGSRRATPAASWWNLRQRGWAMSPWMGAHRWSMGGWAAESSCPKISRRATGPNCGFSDGWTTSSMCMAAK